MTYDPTNVSCCTCFVAPSMAEQYLQQNVNNYRSIDPRKFKEYTKLQKDGLWTDSFSSITFDVLGHLVDGQHRLSAIIESGVGQWHVIVKGVKPESSNKGFLVFDRGKSRTIADALVRLKKAEGVDVARAANVAAALRTLSDLQNGLFDPKNRARSPIDENTAVALLLKNLWVNDLCRAAASTPRSSIVTEVAMLFVCHGWSVGDALSVVRYYKAANWESEKDPLFVLYKRFLSDATSRTKLNRLSLLTFTIRAFNLFLSGDDATMRNLAKLGPDASTPLVNAPTKSKGKP